jgi:glycosyltransferase involved in cell wall biosynthesis
MHYAVPRVLHAAGALEMFHTDLCASKGVAQLAGLVPVRLRPDALQRIVERSPEGVPQGRITAYNSFGFEYARRLRAARSEEQRIGAYLWAGRVFCSKVLARGFGAADSVFGFNTAVLEILQSAKQRGLQTVMEQTIAPSGIEADLLDAERAAFPDWAEQDQPSPLRREVADREASEWDLADVILCGSGFVREGVRGCGGPADRCVVVPYGVSLSPLTERREPHQPLRVLVVGAVGLRKGSPYVVEAARRLGGATEFRLVGPGGASASGPS